MDFYELPFDVRMEVSDPLYYTLTHGRKGTYQAGCRGPLCRKVERDTKRKEYAQRVGTVQKRRPRASQARDAELEVIQRWHESLGGEQLPKAS